jgi:uncharacterized membrane protein YqaE (UPF0057 family)
MKLFFYLLAIFIPPAVPLLLGYPVRHIVLNVILTSLFWIPGVLHAVICVWGHYEYNNAPNVGWFIGYDVND